jgi:23S rRNA pseudouridine2457 synthase
MFNKPMGVICQFSHSEGHPTLKDFIAIPDIYPAGRLDTDSEGLLLLTNDGQLQKKITDPKHKWPKTYWVQVEGIADDAALQALADGIRLNDGLTLPAEVTRLTPPETLWERTPPIRVRAAIPTSWISMTLREGRNRQVRRMTAAVGLPTLRLIRWSVGPYSLEGLSTGTWRDVRITSGFNAGSTDF